MKIREKNFMAAMYREGTYKADDVYAGLLRSLILLAVSARFDMRKRELTPFVSRYPMPIHVPEDCSQERARPRRPGTLE